MQPASLIVWVRARSHSGKLMSYRVRLAVDGQQVSEQPISFDYLCLGHGGPVVDAPLWDVLRRSAQVPTDAPTFDVPAGKHQLRISVAAEADLLLDQVVVTNDLGYLPPGRCDFLIQPVRPETDPEP